MHLGSRDIVWMRVSKDSFKKGLNSLRYLGLVLQRLFKAQYPIIEKIQVTFITDEEKVKEFLEGIAKPSFKSRDEKARGLKDEEVDVFYGCTLCQSFAPSHVCIITPNRPSLCGAISWFDARASVKVNPKGHYFPVDKGELIDAVKGEYTGVNSVVKEKSYGSIERVYLYSALECPQSSCGCFEALGFYIPEVDGIGIVNRGFKGNTVNGLAFSTLAGQASGGRQVVGMVGISYTYMQSPKFLQADGGWERVVWMTSEAKERVREFIAPHVVDKIATEKEATNIDELRAWVKKVGHPVYDRQMKELREAVSLLIQKAGPLSLDEVYECFKGEVDKEMIKEVLDKLRGEGG
jgi:acetyl-CoA decarbonylase/synthase complex subunit beta